MASATLTKEQRHHFCATYLARRQRARTDLFWLANEVLSPPDSKIMTRRTHGVISDHCQTFKGYKELMSAENMRIIAAECLSPMAELEGERDRLLLASRGHLKTTIQVVAHSIQWIINYPNVRILVCTSTDEKAQLVVGKIKQHFQFNRKFRFLFPEFCPSAKKVSDWGSKTEIVVPNASRRDEPTIMTAAVGKALASTHHDVIKATDVVTENNVKTPGQIQEVMDFFGYLEPLRERFESKDGQPNPAWLDIEGTIYDFSDFHQQTVDAIKNDPDSRIKLTKQSCWADKDKRIPWWPERFPMLELDRIRKSRQVGPILFASQYELDPVPPGEGLATLDDIRFFPLKVARELMPRYTVQTTVDLNGMDPNSTTSDFAVFTVAGFDRDGRLDVLAIHRGRWSDEEIIELFFLIQYTYPSNMRFKMQKDHLTVGLQSGLRREMEKRKKWLVIEPRTISTTESKRYRIKKSLQGWFKMGLIRFSEAIGSKERPTETSTALINEILRFPKGANDDILDTLADHFMDRDGDSATESVPREKMPGEPEIPGRLPEFDPFRVYHEPEMSNYYADVTGI